MTTPRQDFGAVVWEQGRSVHAKCMDCRWVRVGNQTNEPAQRHTRATGHSVMLAGMMTYLVVPERGRG